MVAPRDDQGAVPPRGDVRERGALARPAPMVLPRLAVRAEEAGQRDRVAVPLGRVLAVEHREAARGGGHRRRGKRRGGATRRAVTARAAGREDGMLKCGAGSRARADSSSSSARDDRPVGSFFAQTGDRASHSPPRAGSLGRAPRVAMLRAMSRAGGGLLGGGLLRRASAARRGAGVRARRRARERRAVDDRGRRRPPPRRAPPRRAPPRALSARPRLRSRNGRIEHALFKDHHFDELGIPRPGASGGDDASASSRSSAG